VCGVGIVWSGRSMGYGCGRGIRVLSMGCGCANMGEKLILHFFDFFASHGTTYSLS